MAFIGPSGIGKSTFLETLGLMTNTLVKNNDSHLNFYSKGSKINFFELWQSGDHILSKFRKHHYSFIFQSTNLFENLGCIENAALPLMVQGTSKEVAYHKARIMFEELNLPIETPLKYPITNWAGGQRQRLAFARAFSNSPVVLFADEPTGNLDTANARNVMSLIKNKVSSSEGGNFTAIIVTHDINLALNFADSIVLITKKVNKSFGNIDMSTTFDRSDENIWANRSLAIRLNGEEFSDYIQKLFTRDV
jgi:ABC-type lipoprotein export system ATPase subunit